MTPPRVTAIMLAYNDERFVGEAIDSMLGQDYPNLDVLISDDCSQDDTWSIVRERVAAFRGPHQVQCIRQPQNTFPDHLKVLWPRVEGEYCVYFSADDVSSPTRTRTVIDHHLGTGAVVVSSNAHLIDEDGKVIGIHRDPSATMDLSLDEYCRTGLSPVCFGAGMSWHRSVFDYFGPLHPTVRNSDVLVPFRGMLLGNVFYDPVPLVRWRQHAGNMTLSKKVKEAASEAERLQAEERRLNNWVANRYGMLADLKLHVSRVGRSKALDTVRMALLNQLMMLLEEWLLLRTRMAHLRIGLV